MSEVALVSINGSWCAVEPHTSIAAAILRAGVVGFRRSINGDLRGPLCGMGICFECRVRVNGLQHVKSCQIECESGMEIETDE